MVKPKVPGVRSKRFNISLISHVLTFAAGLIIQSLVSREDCGDAGVIQEISKYNSPNPPPTALRLQTQPQTTASLSAPTALEESKEDEELSFLDIGLATGTDKVLGERNLALCLKDCKTACVTNAEREECRPFGHFYHTMYQQKLGSYSRKDATPAEGKWPWGNFSEQNPRYKQYLDENRLHCGDGNDVNFLMDVLKNKMKVPGAPPLKIVVDDASHEAAHMAQTVLFWLPRIEPGGILFVEDVQPSDVANPWATQFLPQIMKDLHYCGNKDKPTEDEACFPTLVGMIQSIHCEMHICAFERNQAPAKELSLEESSLPANALDMKKCKSMLPGHW